MKYNLLPRLNFGEEICISKDGLHLERGVHLEKLNLFCNKKIIILKC
jgi:hypothetical protein